MHWKENDLALCLQDHYDQFTKGRVYVVTNTRSRSLNMIDDLGHYNGWGKEFFQRIPYESLSALEKEIYDLPRKIRY